MYYTLVIIHLHTFEHAWADSKTTDSLTYMLHTNKRSYTYACKLAPAGLLGPARLSVNGQSPPAGLACTDVFLSILPGSDHSKVPQERDGGGVWLSLLTHSGAFQNPTSNTLNTTIHPGQLLQHMLIFHLTSAGRC